MLYLYSQVFNLAHTVRQCSAGFGPPSIATTIYGSNYCTKQTT